MTDEPHSFGWKRQLPDYRDRPRRLAPNIALPRHIDRHAECPPIWNQGQLGSCTAHGTLRAYCHMRKRSGETVFMASRLLQYYDSRELEGTTWVDAGATCRDAIKATGRWGACDESLWPYDIHRFAIKPTDTVYAEAAKHKSLVYEAVNQDIYSLKAALVSGHVVVFGFAVYENFETSSVTRTGLVPMPEGHSLGGHCVCCVGYNSHNYFCFANSWGTGWGDRDMPGHGWMPPEYILNPNLASDFWIIKQVQS